MLAVISFALLGLGACADTSGKTRSDAYASGSEPGRERSGADGTPGTPSATDDGEPSSVDVNGCNVPNKPSAVIAANEITLADGTPAKEITSSVTLGCTTNWILSGRVFVRAGATLTIQPGTTIRAEKASNAGLVVMPGATLVAAGDKYFPIVITSDQSTPAPGDWRGVVILGNAPPGTGAFFAADPAMPFGGSNADDDSGMVAFTRIEYGTLGLVLAGVGRKTTVDSVQVRKANDNCFTMTGGTVDAKHLVCQYPADEYFELSGGYTGRLQYLFGQKMPDLGIDHNGVLTDAAAPTIYNATLCGDSLTLQNYGVVARNGASLALANAVVTGWFAGFDARGPIGPKLELRSTLAGRNAANPACAETAAVTDATLPTFDDDAGFDEIAWFRTAARSNTESDPGLVACSDPKSPKPYPASALTTGATKPPDDGFFDATSAYLGAFRDANDAWLSGVWTRFDEK
ncbi:MAG: hypothetical protein JWP87_406 [Labilithrix sp.]|nr:hypothetical protein [Labilithrix sp.]